MKKLLLFVILLTACSAAIPAISKDAGRERQSYVLLEAVIIPTQAPTQTATIAPPTETPEPTRVQRSNFPHIADVAYDQIPNHAPGSGDGEIALDNQHDAYFEQYVCVDYVDLRGAPDLSQPPRAWSRYGDIVHVHERQGEWAFIGGGYWVELENLCDF